MSAEWTDDELINYCEVHAETQRALFHGTHVRRMFVLASLDAPSELRDSDFYSMHESMKELVRLARQRQRQPKLSLVP